MSNNQLQLFSNEERLKRIWRLMTALSSVVAIAILIFLLSCSPSGYPVLTKVIAAVWFLGPPAWFAYENSCLLLPEDVELKKERMARFRLGQDAARMGLVRDRRIDNLLHQVLVEWSEPGAKQEPLRQRNLSWIRFRR
jgi:hypothetical protein